MMAGRHRFWNIAPLRKFEISRGLIDKLDTDLQNEVLVIL